MAKNASKTETKLPKSAKALLYARVSSKEQEKEGYSIPAQLKLLRDYAATQNLQVIEEYVDIETAKQSGRANFAEMVGYFRKRAGTRILLVEKTDRLYRNLKDWVTLDELDIEIHLIKEGVVLSRDSRSSEKFMHGIKVLMAKNYIDNLSEEARKGMQEKAEQGIWPTKAPLGYRNVTGPNGKKIIATDPETAPIIRKLFEWYATGTLSLKEAAQKAHEAGLFYRRTGATVPVSAVHTILRNRLYTGEFEWNGRLIQGSHEPLVSREMWDHVQTITEGRNRRNPHPFKHEFAFANLIECGHCGCSLVGELKKQRYVYYHCSGYKGKCGEPYVRQEILERQFTDLLGQLHFDDEIFVLMRKALLNSHEDEAREHEEAIARLHERYDFIQRRLHIVYLDKLDEKIDSDFYEHIVADWRKEQTDILREIERHQAADQSYLNEGIMLLELAQSAQRMFAKQSPLEKKRLLNFLLSNCAWKDGALTARLRQPFDLIAKTATLAAQVPSAEGQNLDEHPVWLGDLDSNQG